MERGMELFIKKKGENYCAGREEGTLLLCNYNVWYI